MKGHAYCYARCNRAKRRLCKKDCRNLDVDGSLVDQSLIDIETFYGAARKSPKTIDWLTAYQAMEKDEEIRRGREVMLLWLVALGTDGHMTTPPSWRIDGIVPLYWDPRSLFRNWKDDVKWFNESKDEAVANGLDSMLDAYYSGVPVEDIVA